MMSGTGVSGVREGEVVMSQSADAQPGGPAGGTQPGLQAPAVIDEAGRQLRAPWAAGIAGLLFAILFTGALLLLRTDTFTTATDAQLAVLFATGGYLPIVIGGLYLAPFSGILFLWFLAVVRDQIGEREDRFFATVFFGSGLLFVALVLAAAAVTSTLVVGYLYLDQPPPSAALVAALRALSYTLLFGFATRAAAVFLISMGTIGFRSRTFPNWFAWTGYLLGAILLLAVSFWDWSILVLPAWVAVVSVFILRRERARRPEATPDRVQ
jgi:hypothetical protein